MAFIQILLCIQAALCFPVQAHPKHVHNSAYKTDGPCRPAEGLVYRLISVKTGLPIGLPPSDEDEIPVESGANDPNENSLLTFVLAENNFHDENIYMIQHLKNGKMLDIEHHSKDENALLVQKHTTGEPCQKFRFKQVGKYCLIKNVGSGRYLVPDMQDNGNQRVVQKSKKEKEEQYWSLVSVSG